jgi:hypothetical protein
MPPAGYRDVGQTAYSVTGGTHRAHRPEQEERAMALRRRNREPEVVIDLRDPAPQATPQWGSPIPCTECSGRGYLDHIDPFKQIMYLHCTVCGHRYDINKEELESVAS